MADSGEDLIETGHENGTDPARSDTTDQRGAQTAGTTDEELREVIRDQQTRITVMGCGGGGCNTINRMQQSGIQGADLVAVNTDAQHLTQVQADSKLLIGKQVTQGRGTGSLPQIGEEAARENQAAITDAVEDAEMVFVTAGLGGGTGTGAAPVVANTAREAGALTIAIVTMPFTSEGEVRRTNAQAGLERLRHVADTVIVIPNDRLLETAGDLPIQQAFTVADEVLMRSVKGVTELVTQPSLVNLDFADLTTIMETGGVAMIGFGESDTESRARDAARSAVRSPLLDIDITGANAALVNVTGGPDMTIEEAETVVRNIHDQLEVGARIIWGASIDETMDGMIRTMLVVTGVSSPQVYGREESSTIDHIG